jgi:hypothetical protein
MSSRHRRADSGIVSSAIGRDVNQVPALRLYPEATVKYGLALGAAVLLAIAAFRRARGVLRPGPRDSIARPAEGNPPGQATSALVTAAMVGAAVAVVIGIVWVSLELLW